MVRATEIRYQINIPGRRYASYEDLLRCQACMKAQEAGVGQRCYQGACWFKVFEKWHPEEAEYVKKNLMADEESGEE